MDFHTLVTLWYPRAAAIIRQIETQRVTGTVAGIAELLGGK
ncbi:hypothetical protein [Aurantimonas sp. DM33-3]|nr:hypothetical protein [Aurantimonas sp. DM33-3]